MADDLKDEYESEYTKGIITKRCIRCEHQEQMGRYKWLPEGWGVIYFDTRDAPGWSLCGRCLAWFLANSEGLAERMDQERQCEADFAEQQKRQPPSFEFEKLGET